MQQSLVIKQMKILNSEIQFAASECEVGFIGNCK